MTESGDLFPRIRGRDGFAISSPRPPTLALAPSPDPQSGSGSETPFLPRWWRRKTSTTWSFYAAESRHRRALTPLRSDLLPAALAHYALASRLDLSLCPRITDATLASVNGALRSSLRSIDLSRSRGFSQAGVGNLAVNCAALVEINLSNATDLSDAAAAAIGRARNLERLWLARCKVMVDMGIGCIAVGCQKLRLLCLKWCLGISDLGFGLVAVKCKRLRCLDLSFMPITKKCLPAVLQLLQLPHLEDVALVGCLSIDDEGLVTLKQEFKSLQVLDMSNCQHVSHAAFSSMLNKVPGLRQMSLAYNCLVTHSLGSSLQKEGLRLISQCCHLLEELDLTDNDLDDEGLPSRDVKSYGFPLLQIINLAYCTGTTDDSLRSLSKCSNLDTLEIRGCPQVSSLSLAAISVGCQKLTNLGIKKCYYVNDAGILFSCLLLQNLRQVELEPSEVWKQQSQEVHVLSLTCEPAENNTFPSTPPVFQQPGDWISPESYGSRWPKHDCLAGISDGHFLSHL
ncbi:hypothetical protein OPV22_033995 [Ensete ventricosum]|uniref:COI1 F-box domain-containing protein n=1 Tax=Ensete ventricosum TaxID=4639 RepID=A0AAV8Q3J1_ENSVE|nr:hypothetical protein OPV22_033995 [Ensete ventricosum]